MSIGIVLFCAALIGVSSTDANAQTAAPATGIVGGMPARADMKRGERKFLEKAAQHNLAEIQTGRLAAAQAANSEVKNFGKMMEQDHTKAYEEVVQLAKAKGVSLPGEPDRGHKKGAEKLQKLTGAEFDRKYMSEMVKDHEKDVKEFQKMSRAAKDPDVKAFASKTLPVLEGHLRMARDVYMTTRNPK
jgi:putative membrane protein